MVEPYITKEEIRRRLTNIPASDSIDELLEEICVEVTDVVATELGFEFDDYETGTRIVYGYGTPTLSLPPHAFGTVTVVEWGASGSAEPLTDWEESTEGTLLRTSSSVYSSPFRPDAYGWALGGYTVTADWGYGEPPPAVKKVCLELAVNTWRAKDKGLYTDIIGVEGSGGLRYIGGLTNQQQNILDSVKRKYQGGVVFA